jgi:excisionase family DNA binding protein
MKDTQILHPQNLPDSMFLTFLETAIKNAAEPILTKLFEDSHRSQLNRELGEEPIDIDEAARIIKKSKNTVYSYCSKGTIVFHKSGNKTLFYRSELLIWLKSKNY